MPGHRTTVGAFAGDSYRTRCADRLLNLPRARAQGSGFALGAIRFARGAAAAAMPDEPVTEKRPLLARDDAHQILLDFFRRRLARQAEALREARDVGVPTTPTFWSKALPSTTFAVFRPTPARCVSSSMLRGTSPPWRATSSAQHARMFFAFARKKPVAKRWASPAASRRSSF